MSQLEQAIAYMRQHGGLTDFACWHSVDRFGVARWHASVKIDERSCYVEQGIEPLEPLLAALGRAYANIPNRKGLIPR